MQAGCKTDKAVNSLFTQSQLELMDEIAETILPKTSTPGAKDAAVGAFMSVFVLDCYTPAQQQVFKEGLLQLDQASRKAHGSSFVKARPEQRTALLQQLDGEQAAYYQTKKYADPAHYFRLLKELTLLGFFSSKPGATEVLRYEAVPGHYDGDFPYKKGDRAWATS